MNEAILGAPDQTDPPDGPDRLVVLVVEDEPLLRMIAVDLVKEAGLDAVGVVDAAAALHVLGWRRDIRIVFSDIEMPPGIDGLQLASTIERNWPEIPTILTSGRRHPGHGELSERNVFIAKPYRGSEIVEAIKRLAA